MQLLGTVLGGGMSSRLFQSIREEAGLAYSVYTYTDFCHDTGIFCSSLAVNSETAGAAIELTLKEMEKLRRDGFSEAELESAKAQVRGGVLMGLESLSTRMNRLARSFVYHGRYQEVEELLGNFERLTVDDVMNQTADILDPARHTLVTRLRIPARSRSCPGWRLTSAEIRSGGPAHDHRRIHAPGSPGRGSRTDDARRRRLRPARLPRATRRAAAGRPGAHPHRAVHRGACGP